MRRTRWIFFPALLLISCGGDTGTGPIAANCTTPILVTLEPGATLFLDAARVSNCIGLPGGTAAREYLVVTYSGAGSETNSGVSASYAISAGSGSSLVAPNPLSSLLGSWVAEAPSGSTAFHEQLRRSEAALAADQAQRLQDAWSRMPALAQVPILGQRDSFNVCRNLTCTAFNRVGATVRYVGRSGVVYTDDANPANADQLSDNDLASLGALFDDYLYPIDTTAFGRESDIDGDQRVAILLTVGVNELTTDCTNGRVIGYFYGADLLTTAPGSNRREVFYTFAPRAATPSCSAVTRSVALRSLPPVLIHEMQHMISFNQRVRVRGGSAEDLWLNEGLSHFAEELGYRGIPDARCTGASSCFAQFVAGDLSNAYSYLNNPEATHLVTPGDNSGPLAYRGAAWLFVRWLADHHSSDTLLGTQVTRNLVQSTRIGATNVAAVAATDFPTLVGEWQLANYLENLTGFPQVGKLRYRSWNLRAVYAANSPTVYPKPYPLTPDSTTGSYTRNGTLRGGSGRHVRFQLPPGSPTVTVQLRGGSGSAPPSSVAEPRIAVVRIR